MRKLRKEVSNGRLTPVQRLRLRLDFLFSEDTMMVIANQHGVNHGTVSRNTTGCQLRRPVDPNIIAKLYYLWCDEAGRLGEMTVFQFMWLCLGLVKLQEHRDRLEDLAVALMRRFLCEKSARAHNADFSTAPPASSQTATIADHSNAGEFLS